MSAVGSFPTIYRHARRAYFPNTRHDLFNQIFRHRNIGVITHLAAEYNRLRIPLQCGVRVKILGIDTIRQNRNLRGSMSAGNEFKHGIAIGYRGDQGMVKLTDQIRFLPVQFVEAQNVS